MDTKTCTVCGNEYPATREYFYKNNDGLYGLTSSCKECKKIALRRSREKNPNYMKEYYKKNKDKLSENQKQYYLNHREKYLESFKVYSKKYYKENIEKIEVYRKKWATENPEYFKEHYKQNKIKRYKYYIENRERILKVKKVWRSKIEVKNREAQRQRERYKDEKHRTIRLVNNQKRRCLAKINPLAVEEWNGIKVLFDNSCAYCGEKTKLTQDHIVPLSKGGIYRKGNIVPACSKCNSSKNNKDLIEWYKQQEFYSEDRLQSILKYQTEG